MVSELFDEREARDPTERETALMSQLPSIIAIAKQHCPAYRKLFGEVEPAAVVDRAALAQLPLTRKSDLIELQRQNPPFGGFAAVPVSALAPGLRLARADLRAGGPGGRISGAWRGRSMPPGSGAGDLVHNTFSYHLTPAGAMVESAARGARLPGHSGRHRPDRAAAARRSPICSRLAMSARRPF